MRITTLRERSVPISRYDDPSIPSGGLTTSVVALVTDVVRDGAPVVGYGFGSIGRFAQSGLIAERFAPRLLAAPPEILDDPFAAWSAMMRGEKPGGHGERCVAVGALDMALWDAASKVAGLPLHRFLARRLGRPEPAAPVALYASGGYRYPHDDLARLRDELRRLVDAGYQRIKIKIGGAPLDDDRRRIETALGIVPSERLAVDAMNAYDARTSLEAATALAPYGLWWFEDVCDPLDFETLAAVAARYPGALGVGEALFSDAEAVLLARHGGLRPGHDVLQFDPAHCYGIPGFVRIVDALVARGWRRADFWPHGGHLFTLHVVAALGLGGCETNPLAFAPFGGLPDGASPVQGAAALPESPGIGFETRGALGALFASLGA